MFCIVKRQRQGPLACTAKQHQIGAWVVSKPLNACHLTQVEHANNHQVECRPRLRPKPKQTLQPGKAGAECLASNCLWHARNSGGPAP